MADLEEILPEVFYLGNFMVKIVLIHLESKVAHSYLQQSIFGKPLLPGAFHVLLFR